MGVEIAGEQHGPALVAQIVHDRAHLGGAVRTRAMHLEMRGDGDERIARPFHGRHERDVAAVHALEVEVPVLGARQLEDAYLRQRPAREDREPEQRFLVRALRHAGEIVVPPVRHLDQQRRPRGVSPQCHGEVARDVTISGARHPEIHLVEQVNVRVDQQGMLRERRFDLRVAIAVLDVPVHGAHACARERVGWRRRRRLVDAQRTQHALEPRCEPGPCSARAQRRERRMRRERVDERLTLRDERRIARHRTRVQTEPPGS